MSDETEYFTVVFRGDIRKLGFNPLFAQTMFGEVVGVSVGDSLKDLWDWKGGTEPAQTASDPRAALKVVKFVSERLTDEQLREWRGSLDASGKPIAADDAIALLDEALALRGRVAQLEGGAEASSLSNRSPRKWTSKPRTVLITNTPTTRW